MHKNKPIVDIDKEMTPIPMEKGAEEIPEDIPSKIEEDIVKSDMRPRRIS